MWRISDMWRILDFLLYIQHKAIQFFGFHIVNTVEQSNRKQSLYKRNYLTNAQNMQTHWILKFANGLDFGKYNNIGDFMQM